MKIKKGDKVKVLNGKDRGRTGTVLAVIRKSGKVVVEGINIVTKFEKKKDEAHKGGIKKEEAPMYACKLKVLDDEGKPVKKTKKTVKKNK